MAADISKEAKVTRTDLVKRIIVTRQIGTAVRTTVKNGELVTMVQTGIDFADIATSRLESEGFTVTRKVLSDNYTVQLFV